MSQHYIRIVVDTNDADYAESTLPITPKQLSALKPLIAAIKAFKPYTGVSNSGMTFTHNSNYPHGEYAPRTDLGEKTPEELYPDIPEKTHQMFQDDFLPYGEYGLHSVKHVEVFQMTEVDKLL